MAPVTDNANFNIKVGVFMKGNCFELQTFKIAREKAQTEVYTPPELEILEEKIRSPKLKRYHKAWI